MGSVTQQAEAVRISKLEHAHLRAVAGAHRRAFPESFLSALGTGAVTRYYRWQLEGPHDCVAVVAEVHGQLAGFCFAGVFRGAMTGFLRRNRAYLAVQLALRGGLISNGAFRKRILGGIRLLLRPAKGKAPSPGHVEPFGILSIAVDPAFQGLGVGKRLMEACETIARERGFSEMALVVAPGNRRAISFYESIGWARVRAAGEWDGRMRKVIA